MKSVKCVSENPQILQNIHQKHTETSDINFFYYLKRMSQAIM